MPGDVIAEGIVRILADVALRIVVNIFIDMCFYPTGRLVLLIATLGKFDPSRSMKRKRADQARIRVATWLLGGLVWVAPLAIYLMIPRW